MVKRKILLYNRNWFFNRGYITGTLFCKAFAANAIKKTGKINSYKG